MSRLLTNGPLPSITITDKNVQIPVTVTINEGNGVVNNGEPITGNKAGNNNQVTTKRLPQTGDTKDSTAIAGLGLLALASLLGFGKRQKRD